MTCLASLPLLRPASPLALLPLAVLLMVGCPSAPPTSIRQDVTPAQPDITPRTPPWLRVETGFADQQAAAEYLTNVSGYARLVFAGADPEWGDISQFEVLGAINPNLRLLDVDGDGRLDPTGDLSVFSGGGGEILVWGGEANVGTTVRIGVILYTFVGDPLLELWFDEPVRLEPSDDAPRVKFGPVGTPSAAPPCYDGQDNDGDGWTDGMDSDCQGGGPLLERGLGITTCNDGVDNDGDGTSDADDPDCRDGGDLSELPSCADGLDDDGDTWTDAADPDCQGGDSEVGPGATACNDGLDNDLDSFIDALDPSCATAGGDED